MNDGNVIREILDLNKNLSDVSTIAEVSSNLKQILINYKESIASLDNSMDSFIENIVDSNKKVNSLESMVTECINSFEVLDYSKMETILNETRNSINEHNNTISTLFSNIYSEKADLLVNLDTISKRLIQSEENFIASIDDIKRSSLKLSNYLKDRLLDEIGLLRDEINAYKTEKEQLIQEIKAMREDLSTEYTREVRDIKESFTSIYKEIQTENREIRNETSEIIKQNIILLKIVQGLSKQNEEYQSFINEYMDNWSKDHIRGFARK
jgi:uncharacterized coiled-coil DUF342 family protein